MTDSPGGNERFQGRKTMPEFLRPDEPAGPVEPERETETDGTPAQPEWQAAIDTGAQRLMKSVQSVAFPVVEPDRDREPPLVEVEVIHEHGPAPMPELLRRTLEVYTANHVYVLDPHMRCIEVRNPATGEQVTDHTFLGARLVGGQRQGEQVFELSYPLPLPGNLAVFEGRKGKQKLFSTTSLVKRMVIRLHLVTVPVNRVAPTWAKLTSGGGAKE